MIIDHATKILLDQHRNSDYEVFDSLRAEAPVGNFSFAIVPGCTLLTPGQAPGVETLRRLRIPVHCLAGNLWEPGPAKGILLRKRILRFRSPSLPDLSVVRMCTPPVGCRDPQTFSRITSAGIAARYTGCPTLLLPPENIADDGFVLFSFGRHRIRTQVRYGQSLLHHSLPVIGICHEIGDYERIRAAGWKLPLVTFRDDLNLYLSYFQRAHIVVTGRLHGALPSLAYGKKVFYFGTTDSRTSLLDDLGVPVYRYADIPFALKLANSGFNHELLRKFAKEWAEMLSGIFQNQSLLPDAR
jgi:hypothetical protein